MAEMETSETPIPTIVGNALANMKDQNTCETCKIVVGGEGKDDSLDVLDAWEKMAEEDPVLGVLFSRHSKTSYDKNFRKGKN